MNGPATTSRDPENILVLGAGAPHSPLMAGALCAISRWMQQNGKRPFRTIYTSGGGALIGLLFLAPKQGTPDEALQSVVEFGVADAIYRLFPIGFKTFFKPGPFTGPFRRAAGSVKDVVGPLGTAWIRAGMELLGGSPSPAEEPRGIARRAGDPARRLFNDLVDFWFSLLTPAILTPHSLGLCAHAPFIEELIDFDRVNEFPAGSFVVNVYNLTRHEMCEVGNPELTPQHIRAATAFPFIYPPVKIGEDYYIEGAGHDPINLPKLMRRVTDVCGWMDPASERLDNVVLIDILSQLTTDLLRAPRGLWEAYGMSLITPVVELAKDDIKGFEEANKSQQRCKLLKVEIKVREELRENILQWSFSNLSALWDLGYQEGENFCKEKGQALA